MTKSSNDQNVGNRRLPAKLVAEARDAMITDPRSYRSRELGNYYSANRRQIATELMASGIDRARAMSQSDREVRRRAEATVPPLERFGAGDPALVHRAASDELDRVRRLAHGSQTDLRQALGRLRAWGVLRTTIKESVRRRSDRRPRRTAVDIEAEQRQIVREVVPTWEWPYGDLIAPGLHGFVDTNRNGAIHIWTMVADAPLSGAGARFLNSLPTDRRIRAFGVAKGSLSEAMLLRRGFLRSRYAWHGLRGKESVSASAWTWMYR